MSGLIKSVGRAVKKVVSGVKKVFKKIASSKIGKVILIAAAIYLGGAALGAWQSPFASINGAFTSAGSQASQMAAANNAVATGSFGVPTASASTGLNAAALPGGTTGGAGFSVGGTTSTVAAPATGTGAGFSAGGVNSTVASSGATTGTASAATPGLISGGANPAAAQVASGSAGTGVTGSSVPSEILSGATKNTAENTVQRMMSSTADILKKPFADGNFLGADGWVARNPVPAMLATNAVAGALTPDGIDLQREQDRLMQEEEERAQDRRRQSYLLNDIDVGRPNDVQLKNTEGGLLFNRSGT